MMDFVFCTDKNYAKWYGVLMLSILRFAPPQATEPLRFHVLSEDIDEAGKTTLKGIATRRENVEVCFYAPAQMLSKETIDVIDMAAVSIQSHVTKSTYYSLLIADLLPRDIHRVLYLDGDVLCTSALGDIFLTDLKDFPCGMCIDLFAKQVSTYNRLNYPPQEGYFNSGVILFDLDKWRQENISEAMIKWLKTNAKRRLFHDQDVINAVLHGRIFPLDFSCNVMSCCLYVFYWLQEEKNRYYANETQYLFKDNWSALLAAIENPRFLHFAGDSAAKPWYRECDQPFAPVWRYFYDQSPWKGEPLKFYRATLPVKTRIKKFGRKAFERLNLLVPVTVSYPEEAFASARRLMDRLMLEDTDSRQGRQTN